MNIKNAFQDVFEKYIDEVKLISVKTSNMGTLYQITYEVVEKKEIDEKSFIDELRVLNGNLNISLGYAESDAAVL